MTSDSSSDNQEQEDYHEWMDQRLKEINEEVRSRDRCRWCGDRVGEDDYSWKYAAAGGVLAGPFCGRPCQFAWLNAPPEEDLKERRHLSLLEIDDDDHCQICGIELKADAEACEDCLQRELPAVKE